MFDLTAIQTALREFQLDGWLLYDFRGNNILASRVLDIPENQIGSRRFFYFIPVDGTPQKLVHRIESAVLDHLPGEKEIYLRWQELEAGVAKLVNGTQTVAMEYSPRNANPYISRVDAGTLELVRGQDVRVVSSGDLVQLFEATWTDRQWQLHQEADRGTQAAFERAWGFIGQTIRDRGSVGELEIQQTIMSHFAEHGMTTYHPPIVGVGPHSGDPHYMPTEESSAEISEGDFVLIDLWAKMDQTNAVYSDLKTVGFVGESVPDVYEELFQITVNARDAAIGLVRSAFSEGRVLQGWEVDQAARDVIEATGYGPYFVHRTGHSIGQETHANGTNMDNLETREERRVLSRTCFSIEPGIYLAEFGVRTEVNVYVDENGQVHVTGGLQNRVLPILAEH